MFVYVHVHGCVYVCVCVCRYFGTVRVHVYMCVYVCMRVYWCVHVSSFIDIPTLQLDFRGMEIC